jgi:formylglycine-generating enzyme
MKIQNPNRSGSRITAFGFAAVLFAILCATPFAARAGLPPVVTNVMASQQALPSKLVDIYYTLSDPDSLSASISILVSSNSGVTWSVPATNFTGDYGAVVSDNATPTIKHVIWNAGTDFNGQFSTTCRVRVIANDDDYALVPGGTFTMGDNLDGESDAPTHLVYVSSFYMDTNLVTGAGWALVLNYAVTNGYTFDNYGSYQGLNYPVQSIDWFDAAKWCNARSQMLGATPVYYLDPTFTNVFFNVNVSPTPPFPAIYVNTNANGYRLPTEAEWEKAARGGLAGQRFPLGGTISEAQANYYSQTNYAYDLGPYGYNSNYITSTIPYTSPVGSFAPNGYGIYDMTGNVYEWCQDWNAAYATTPVPVVNPQGPTLVNGNRVIRGGSWNFDASTLRCATRAQITPGSTGLNGNLGFRCVRSY